MYFRTVYDAALNRVSGYEPATYSNPDPLAKTRIDEGNYVVAIDYAADGQLENSKAARKQAAEYMDILRASMKRFGFREIQMQDIGRSSTLLLEFAHNSNDMNNATFLLALKDSINAIRQRHPADARGR